MEAQDRSGRGEEDSVLRCNKDRRLMLQEGKDAGTAALMTGYESSSQFNREYKRQFGAPPRRDVAPRHS